MIKYFDLSFVKVKFKTKKLYISLSSILSTSLLSNIITVLTGLVIGKWVPPSDYGLWVSIGIIPSYFFFLQIGVINGLGKDLPIAIGKNHYKEASFLIRTTSSFVMISGIIICLSIYFFGLAFSDIRNNDLLLGLTSISIATFFLIFSNLCFVIGRSYRKFKILSIIQLVQAILSLVSICFVYFFNLKGLFIRYIIIQLSIALIYYFVFRNYFSFSFNLKVLKKLVNSGFPLFLIGYCATLYSIADRSLAVIYFDKFSIGIYGYASFIYLGLKSFMDKIGEVLYPEMAIEYGSNKTKNLFSLEQTFLKITFSVLIPITILLIFLIPLFFHFFLPLYKSAIMISLILLISVLVESFSSIICIQLIVTNNSWHYFMIYVLRVTFIWIFGFILLSICRSLYMLATAHVLATISFTAAIIYLKSKKLKFIKNVP